MNIYLDILFMINLIYDFLILNTVNIVLRRNVKIKYIFIGSLVGSLSILTLFIPSINNILFTIILSIIMTITSFGYKDIIYLKNNILYFYMISVIFGGFLYLINLKINNFYNQYDYYNRKVLINFIGIVIFGIIVYFLYLYTYKNNNINHNNYYDIKVSLDNKLHNITGFYDSGNLIKDPYKNKPVILINKEILTCDIKNKSPIYVPCKMINNDILIECYKPSLLIINNKVINNCLIGLWSNNNFYDGIDALISGYIGDKIR